VIKLTRLDGSELTINANLIEVIEAHPDTVVKLITGKKFLVVETPAEITEGIIAFYKEAGGPNLIVYEDHCYRNDEDIAS